MSICVFPVKRKGQSLSRCGRLGIHEVPHGKLCSLHDKIYTNKTEAMREKLFIAMAKIEGQNKTEETPKVDKKKEKKFKKKEPEQEPESEEEEETTQDLPDEQE